MKVVFTYVLQVGRKMVPRNKITNKRKFKTSFTSFVIKGLHLRDFLEIS